MCELLLFIKELPWNWGNIIQSIIAATTLVTLWTIRKENKRTTYLPLLKISHEELNSIIFSLYDLFNNPSWQPKVGDTSDWESNYKQQCENYFNGARYFVISSIPTESKDIENRIRHRGSTKMYFNDLKNRYVAIYEALLDALDKSQSSAMGCYFSITEYKKLYEAYKKMPDIK